MSKPSRNGHDQPTALFVVVFGQHLAVLPYSGVIQSLEANAAMQVKSDLRLGSLFRKIADDFRQWSKFSEPGWTFQAPEAHVFIVRLATSAPIATSLSEKAQQELREAKAEPPPDDRTRIITE